MSARVFVDTNVLVYLFDAAEPGKRALAAATLEREGAEHQLVVSTQVLQELYVALTRGNHPIASAELAREAVEAASAYATVEVDAPLVLQAIDLSRQCRLSLWDALIVSAARRAGCQRLLTEDLNAGQVIDGVRIENPFARTSPRSR